MSTFTTAVDRSALCNNRLSCAEFRPFCIAL